MDLIKKSEEIFNRYKIGRYFSIVAIIFFVCYTLTNDYIHQYNTDELWGWDIAADLNLIEIIKLMRYEGHCFVWYYLLKPFTYFDNLYPYAIKYLNWAFAFGFLCILHIYAPISRLLKILITFSLPFMVIYPFSGRVYSLGILLLFLLALMYKKRLKNPIIFALLIFFTANNSLITAFGAFFHAILFLTDLYNANKDTKDYKKIILPAIIVISAFIFLIIQWHHPIIQEYVYNDIVLNSRKKIVWNFYFDYKYPIIQYLSYIAFGLITPVAILINMLKRDRIYVWGGGEKKNILRWFLLAGIPIILINILFIFFYNARYHHMFYIYIYLITLYWIRIDNEKNFTKDSISYKSYTIMLYALSVIFFFPFKNNDFWCFDISTYNESAKIIKEIIPKNSKIYVVLELCQGLVPYLKNDYNLLDINGNKIPSLKAYENIYHSLNNFIPPKDIKINNNENSDVYYLISRIYIDYYQKDIGIDRNKMIAINYDDYYLYKLSDKN